MAAFDPFLYVALALGTSIGLLLHPRSPVISRASEATIVALLFLLGASLAGIPAGELGSSILLSLGLAVLILAFTVGFFLLLAPSSRRVRGSRKARGGPRPFPFSLLLLIALAAGYGVASRAPFPATALIPWALYLLLFLVGISLDFQRRALRRLWVPVTAAVLGALAAGVVFTFTTAESFRASLATTFAFGWYSLDGPIVAASLGASLGLVAFLSNFLRENLTMLSAPYVGPRLGGEGLAAMGGATSMDTTLYFVTRYGDPQGASLALASGLLLTVLASLLVPALLALPL